MVQSEWATVTLPVFAIARSPLELTLLASGARFHLSESRALRGVEVIIGASENTVLAPIIPNAVITFAGEERRTVMPHQFVVAAFSVQVVVPTPTQERVVAGTTIEKVPFMRAAEPGLEVVVASLAEQNGRAAAAVQPVVAVATLCNAKATAQAQRIVAVLTKESGRACAGLESVVTITPLD